MIRLNNVTKKYGDKVVLSAFSCEFPETGFVAITGASGIGKTTLLNLILGLEKPDAGTIEMPSNTAFSVVFQEDRLLQASALTNAAIYYEGKTDGGRKFSEEGRKIAAQILTELGLEADLNTPAHLLSGGMARRVAIARALVAMTGPLAANVCIMDEPIKGLDAAGREQTLSIIRKYCEGKLLIMVTHEEKDADGADCVIHFE